MKDTHETFCGGCDSHCSKNNSPFNYGCYKEGETVVYPLYNNNIVFLLSGELSIRIGDAQDFTCIAGRMALLIAKETYHIVAKQDSSVMILNFVNAYQTCSKIGLADVKYVLGDYKYQFHTLAMHKQIQELIKPAAQYLTDGIVCSHMHQAKMLELFVVLRHYYHLRVLFEFFYPTIDKDIVFQSIVRLHSATANNVEELAKLCNYNINTFKKVFSTMFNESPYKWMLQQKASKIKSQLMENEIPIKAIVAEFGFADQSHLNIFCKKYLGGTSVQIREGIRQ